MKLSVWGLLVHFEVLTLLDSDFCILNPNLTIHPLSKSDGIAADPLDADTVETACQLLGFRSHRPLHNHRAHTGWRPLREGRDVKCERDQE